MIKCVIVPFWNAIGLKYLCFKGSLVHWKNKVTGDRQSMMIKWCWGVPPPYCRPSRGAAPHLELMNKCLFIFGARLKSTSYLMTWIISGIIVKNTRWLNNWWLQPCFKLNFAQLLKWAQPSSSNPSGEETKGVSNTQPAAILSLPSSSNLSVHLFTLRVLSRCTITAHHTGLITASKRVSMKTLISLW